MTKMVRGIIITKQLGANLIDNRFSAEEALDLLKEPESDMLLIGYSDGITVIPRAEILTAFFPAEPMTMGEAREWIEQVKRVN